MQDLVKLQEASDFLRRDTTDDNTALALQISAASSAVRNYLKSSSPYHPDVDSAGDIIIDSDGEIYYETDDLGEYIVLPEVKQAVLYLIQNFYDGNGISEEWEMGYLPRPVICLLYPLRDPAMG